MAARRVALAVAGLTLAFAGLTTGAGIAARAGEPSSGVEILRASSNWRCHVTWKTEMVRDASGNVAPATVKKYVANKGKVSVPVRKFRTDLPPKNWAAPDFDDSEWSLTPGPVFTRKTRSVALICLRGKFTVKDPGALKKGALRLSLAYRGGAVVYVNGKELTRKHLPEGKIDLVTPAEAYPDKAYLNAKGSLICFVNGTLRRKSKDRYALRTRNLEVSVPASALRKGTNVLALELHRAPTSAIMFKARKKGPARYFYWDMIGFEDAKLTAAPGSPVASNVSTPKGLRVWNCPALASVHTTDFGDPHDRLVPIRLSGARNGAFSGKVVVSSDQPIRGLKAEVSALTAKSGGSIKASAVQVRYARLGRHALRSLEYGDGRPLLRHRVRGAVRFDGLESEAPGEVPVRKAGALQPVWVTVNVPRDAKPGEYGGKLTVSVPGAKTVEVPIRLEVADWALPDTRDFATFVGVLQSPESVAMQYKVPMWSKEHWKLLEESFRLLGQLGSNDVYITARAKTYQGNPCSMIRWIKQDDGSWKHDFSIAERYLDLAIKHLGKVPVVGIYVWEVDAGSSYFGNTKNKVVLDDGTPFTVLDPKTGKLTEERAPKFSDPKAAAFWKPVYDGLRRILAKRGLEKSMAASLCPDNRPTADAVKTLKAASGGAPWLSHSHPIVKSVHGESILYASIVWPLCGRKPDPSVKRGYGWKNKWLLTAHVRMGGLGSGMCSDRALGIYHLAMEQTITHPVNPRGIGRLGADFWPVLADKRGRKSALLYRYTAHVRNAWHGGALGTSTPDMLAPGKKGPVATARFEMFREGIQDAEARIFIEKALTDPAKKAVLGAELAKRCREMLDARARVHNLAMTGESYLHFKWYEGSGVLERTARLYAAAATVARRLRK